MSTVGRMGTWFTLCALVAAGGCSVQGRDGDAPPSGTAQPLAIHPGGGQTGALVVAVPAGWSPPSQYQLSVHAAAHPANGTHQLTFGAMTQLDPGTYCLTYFTVSDCTIQIVAGQTVTYTLAALQVSYDDSILDNAYGALQLTLTKTDTKEVFGNPWASNHSGSNEGTYFALAGTYQATLSAPWTPSGALLPPPPSITLAQGQTATWNLTIPEWRFRLHLIVPAREFPDIVGYSDVNVGPSIVKNTYALSDGRTGGTEFPTPASDLILQVPAGQASDGNVTLSVFGVPMTIARGAAGTQIDVPISRLEVDDVVYFLSDGTPATAAGTWSASRIGGAPGPAFTTQLSWNLTAPYWDTSGHLIYSPQSTFATRTGMDVPSGTYSGTVTYDDKDLGGQQQQPFIVTF